MSKTSLVDATVDLVVRIIADACIGYVMGGALKYSEKEEKIFLHIRKQYRRAGQLNTFRVKQIKRGCSR